MLHIYTAYGMPMRSRERPRFYIKPAWTPSPRVLAKTLYYTHGILWHTDCTSSSSRAWITIYGLSLIRLCAKYHNLYCYTLLLSILCIELIQYTIKPSLLVITALYISHLSVRLAVHESRCSRGLLTHNPS